MMCCMIFFHKDIRSHIKVFILETIFRAEDYEIKICNHNTVQILLWNVNKEKIDAAITGFEIENIRVAHGFAKDDIQASEKAWALLSLK